FTAEDGIRVFHVTGVQTCPLPISLNWFPQRLTPATTDVLEFSSNATVTDMPATESIGKLRLHNNAVVNISGTVTSILSIGHATRSEERRVGKESRAECRHARQATK